MGLPQYQQAVDDAGRWTGTMSFHEPTLTKPLQRKKPMTYFVGSMTDLFHPGVQDDWLALIWMTMYTCKQHTFQVLTKRPHRMAEWLRDRPPLPNVWIGTTVENQMAAEERIPTLAGIPAAVRFLSTEPLLGPVELGLFGVIPGREPYQVFHQRIDWVIAGGESGPGARPMEADWARGIRDQCVAAGTPFFFKQWGGDKSAGRVLDGKIWDEYPAVYSVVKER